MTQCKNPGQPGVPDSKSEVRTLEETETRTKRTTTTKTNTQQTTAQISLEDDNNSPINQANETTTTTMVSQSKEANLININADNHSTSKRTKPYDTNTYKQHKPITKRQRK
jgi:hypothetical protein